LESLKIEKVRLAPMDIWQNFSEAGCMPVKQKVDAIGKEIQSLDRNPAKFSHLTFASR
jgi:hypothetical protein